MTPKDEDDCRAVLREMYTYIDGELTAARLQRIDRHMHDCTDCAEVVEFHVELKNFVARTCRDSVPEGLYDRVRRALDNLDGIQRQ